jgi:glycosyltransferase involved in cell wall biosynthesis
MTIAIPSYQRRDPVLRLLRGLDEQVGDSAELRHDLDVVVVLDGSTDGSREAIESERWNVPVRVVWQPNRGLAAARNVGLAAAAGGLVWFLDDDLVPAAGLLEQHRRAHDPGSPSVVVGRCRIPRGSDAPEPYLLWWNDFYEAMKDEAVITRFDRFTAANTSAPAAALDAVGGFDESIVGYGLEDYELAIRLLAAGTLIRFDKDAVAWHPDVPARSVLVGRERSLGCNAARIANLHPETADILFPRTSVSPPRRFIHRLGIRRPRSLMLLSRVSYALSHLTGSAHVTTSRRAEHLARAAAHAAGVAEGDPEGKLLSRVLDGH